MSKQVIDALAARMTKTLGNLRTELAKVRTGRATPTLLDSVKVDYYGSMMPISQVASITCPEARTIQIQPWEGGMLQPIEKAILTANIGLVPQSDGRIIRVPLPMLTEERRKEFVKLVKKLGEENKIALRNERRDANEEVKKLEKGKQLTEDDAKKAQDQVQKKTDEFVAEVDKLIAAKEKEIMSV
ncbi:MAG: ribosome recycling factor [Deltaproteobacteria bacterium]|nr:ribosome recycling factor [Deltaproteobacteria bacterium]